MLACGMSTGGSGCSIHFVSGGGEKSALKREISLRYVGLSHTYFIYPFFRVHGSLLQLGLGVPKFLMFIHHCNNCFVLLPPV